MNKKNLKNTEANVKNNFTSHVDKKNIFDIFVDYLISSTSQHKMVFTYCCLIINFSY